MTASNGGKTAAIIIIGNEILSGKVADRNSAYLSRELRNLGVDLRRIVVVPDEVSVIAEEIASCRKRFDLIFTSGGVGPTHDDVTMEGVAAGVERPLIHHDILDQLLRKVYSGELNAAHMKLADVPEGIELLYSDHLRIPVLHFGNIYIFPGIPELLVRKFEAIKERFRESPFHLNKIFLTREEEAIADHLNASLRRFPRLLLGSYPILHHPDYKVILTLESKDRSYLEEATKLLLSLLPAESILKVESGS
ncbi:MAG TPA: competence/damage-inducible protein A [Candidatus Manganitrophaceae bacterium]|nr:competence/damage-inducible protein A [Candidatus Manganitrophaceae bacterium]